VYLSRENGWFDVNGNATYVRANERYPDDSPAVAALPSIFDKISDDAPPGAVKAAVVKAKAAAAGGGSGG
jgi:hypothetical protein